LKKQVEEQRGVLNRLIDRSLTLTSDKEYQQLKILFPDKGEISRVHGDFLLQHHKKDDAFNTYTHATELFLREGKTFQAIVSKLLAWRIGKPTHADGLAFHNALQTSIKEESPLRHLFSDMSYQELLALMLKLVRVQLKAKQTITRVGQDCQHVFFVVSGTLEETITPVDNPPSGVSVPNEQYLFDNDIFGDIFPLGESTVSLSDVKALTPAEVIKISKAAITDICKRHPRLEQRLAKLYKGPPSESHGRSWSSVRRSTRHENPVRTTVMLSLRQGNQSPVAFEGMSRDISLGGACIDLGLKYGAMRTETFSGIASIVEIKLPSGVGVSIPGRVSWCKKIKEPGGNSIIAGIKFDPLAVDVRDFLKVYCFGYETEQSLMWALWEAYLK
jgi:CRP-like cAMP-binding protein